MNLDLTQIDVNVGGGKVIANVAKPFSNRRLVSFVSDATFALDGCSESTRTQEVPFEESAVRVLRPDLGSLAHVMSEFLDVRQSFPTVKCGNCSTTKTSSIQSVGGIETFEDFYRSVLPMETIKALVLVELSVVHYRYPMK